MNHLGVETKAAYPGCCGMPFLEQAEMEKVATQARKVSAELVKLIDEGYDIIAPTASCGLMLKFEWALVVPDDENVKNVSPMPSSTSMNMSSTLPKKRACRPG